MKLGMQKYVDNYVSTEKTYNYYIESSKVERVYRKIKIHLNGCKLFFQNLFFRREN